MEEEKIYEVEGIKLFTKPQPAVPPAKIALCDGCYFNGHQTMDCNILFTKQLLPSCTEGFPEPVIYIQKPE